MNTNEIIEMHKQYVMPTYAPGLALVKGEGSKVWDADGKEYLDFMAGIAVCSIGHCHPKLTQAIQEQAATLLHVSNLYYNDKQPQLAKVLAEKSLKGKCFFCNSGAEANEGLIKLARLWGKPQGRYEVITMKQSFHGRTLATLTATGQEKVQKGFAPLPEGFAYAEFNNLESCRAAVTDKTAAILVEAVQGEGGIIPADPAFMEGLRALCDEKGILMLCDEVQCGMGRTGHWFGYQAYNAEPDAISVAKALAGGVPMGAIAAGPKLADIFQPGTHATTFGGTPLACAAALAVFEVIESEGLLENAVRMGQLMDEQFAPLIDEYEFLTGFRGMGLMRALECDRPSKPFQTLLQERGLLALTTSETLMRFLPPLNITEADVSKAAGIVREACEAWKAQIEAE